MNQLLKEVPVYLAVAISSLLIMCFFVHAMVGGLVSLETEYTLYALVCLIDITAMVFMARDVIRRRKNAKRD
ncbi:MAG TPA: hypothetical protein VKG67_02780 [Gallionellaceae bacterium]|nr:hypothetical protein [Gallionellaceae bacterium]